MSSSSTKILFLTKQMTIMVILTIRKTVRVKLIDSNDKVGLEASRHYMMLQDIKEQSV